MPQVSRILPADFRHVTKRLAISKNLANALKRFTETWFKFGQMQRQRRIVESSEAYKLYRGKL